MGLFILFCVIVTTSRDPIIAIRVCVFANVSSRYFIVIMKSPHKYIANEVSPLYTIAYRNDNECEVRNEKELQKTTMFIFE